MAAGCPCAHPLLSPAIPEYLLARSEQTCLQRGGGPPLRRNRPTGSGTLPAGNKQACQPPHNPSRAPSVYFLQTCAAQSWRQWPPQRCCWAALPWPPTATTVSAMPVQHLAILATPASHTYRQNATPSRLRALLIAYAPPCHKLLAKELQTGVLLVSKPAHINIACSLSRRLPLLLRPQAGLHVRLLQGSRRVQQRRHAAGASSCSAGFP